MLRKSLLAVLVGAAALVAPVARASIVERVVAVVGERPVFWTELLHRAKPSRIQIRMQAGDPNVVSVQEQEMYKELLEKMIDERLEEQQADKAHIAVSPEEIDRALSNIAAQAQQTQNRPVSVQDLLGEVRRRGMTEQDFREELRWQVLEAKLVELRVRPRVRVTEQDARAAYQHWAQELKQQQPVDVRIIALRVNPPTAQVAQAKLALAQEIVNQARQGTDFCKLVDTYSDDVSTRPTCGSHGSQALASLQPPIQAAIKAFKPGTVSDPIPMQLGQEEVILVLMPMGQASAQPYESVKNEMMQRATLDGLERAKKLWLQELRQNVYIDVRL